MSLLKVREEQIGLDIGQQYIGTMGANRSLSQNWVSYFEKVIKEGYWMLTHQGIAFDQQNRLRDGMHRLTAIVNVALEIKDLKVPMMVARGLDSKAVEAIDINRRRSTADRANILHGEQLGEKTTPRMTAVARAMIEGFQSSTLSVRSTEPAILRFLIMHFDAIRFVEHAGSRVNCMVKAVASRAHYHADHDRLAGFLQVVNTGFCDNKQDIAAVAIRNFVNDKGNATRGSTGPGIIYRKAEHALSAFLARRSLKHLHEVDEELFPLPEEREGR